MRRASGVVVVLALATVLYPLLAFGAFTRGLPASTPQDFPAQVFFRAFGESAAPSGAGYARSDNRLAESFFGSFALRPGGAPAGVGIAFVTLPTVWLPQLSSRLFAPVTIAVLPSTISVRDDDYRVPAIATPIAAAPSAPDPMVEAYQGAGPHAIAPPSAFHFDLTSSTAVAPRLVTFSPVMDPQQAFTAGASGPDSSATLPQTQAGVALPLRVGHVHLQTHVDGAQAQQVQSALHDAALNAGATFNTRVGSHKLNVDVSSGFEHMTVNDPVSAASSFDGTSNYQLSNGNLPVLVPAYADVSKRTLSAGVGVPVARNLSVNVQYDTQRLQGGYGTPGLQNLDARNNIYGGKVTLQIPKSAGAISLSAKQYRYQDNLAPANAFVQTSADVNFTVKF
ncbi:MAG: hypothetical protein M3R51_05035 [Candidatus Eremiobacteraeota bacterium]|nr:hypothetical protein [Candidatus Eremiobacteraeota bacterium]